MKTSVAIILSVMLVMSSIVVINKSNSFEIKILDKGKYCLIEGENYILKDGYPMLPYEIKEYEFPFGTTIKNIEVRIAKIKEIKLEKKILPSVVKTLNENEYEIEEGDIYSKDTFYPEDWYSYKIGGGIKGGDRKVFLTIFLYPYRYNALKNKILHAEKFYVNVEYNLPQNNIFKSEYDLLIIVPSEWAGYVETFRQHKESHGIRTLIATTSEIYRMKGRDEAEKIKYYIKDCIENYGIKYVLLIGDAKNIPARMSYISSYPYEEYFPSDLYYADIYFADGSFCSWDSNDNDLFGEYKYNGNTDEVDLHPDVAIGRIACSNERELNDVLNKIIEYEKNACDEKWFKNLLVCGGDTFVKEDEYNIYEGEYLNEKVISIMNDFHPIKLWASIGNLSSSSINKAINDGVGFVDFSGHGNEYSWATHPPLNENKWIGYTIMDIPSLTNGNKLPLIVIDGCSCGKFDEGDSFAWKFVEKSGGGGIASLAASGIAYGTIGNPPPVAFLSWMEVNTFKYYKQNSLLGDIWVDCINGYLKSFPKSEAHYKTVEEWIIFGDPTLKIGGYESEEAYVYIDKPLDGYFYLFGNAIRQTFSGNTIIIGGITVEVSAYNVDKVEFYIDDALKYIDDEIPYQWEIDRLVGWHKLKVIGYGKGVAEDEISFFILKL